MVTQAPLPSFAFAAASPSIILVCQKSAMQHVFSRRQQNRKWSTRKDRQGPFAPRNVRAYSVRTVDPVANDIRDVRWMSAGCSMQRRTSKVEKCICGTSSIGTRATLTTADTRGRVASQVDLQRSQAVTDTIDVYRVTIRSRAGCQGAKSDRQSSKIAEVYLQLAREQAITIGDLNVTEAFYGKHGTTATPGNVDHFYENCTHATMEAVDPDYAVNSSWISVHKEDRRRGLCGLDPPPGLCSPRFLDFAVCLPAVRFTLHYPGLATSPLLQRGLVQGLRAQTSRMTSRREGRLAVSPPPVRRYDRGQLLATLGWRRVGTHVTLGHVVVRDRDIAAIPEHRRCGGRCGKPRAHGTPGRRYGAPRALAAPQPKVPAGPQYMSSPSSAAVVVIVGVVVVLGRGGTGYDVTGRAPILQFPVLADRKSTGVMRLRPPTPRRTTARCQC
ncbi:uncharacterized protein LOC142774197 [Rhipicephalus microplus]|uniref:uncharacterized protein LOC142774197 n=1 Tax=Rhipicephalus microplus TaxID=6941 RepID=UPI003F6B8F11